MSKVIRPAEYTHRIFADRIERARRTYLEYVVDHLVAFLDRRQLSFGPAGGTVRRRLGLDVERRGHQQHDGQHDEHVGHGRELGPGRVPVMSPDDLDERPQLRTVAARAAAIRTRRKAGGGHAQVDQSHGPLNVVDDDAETDDWTARLRRGRYGQRPLREDVR